MENLDRKFDEFLNLNKKIKIFNTFLGMFSSNKFASRVIMVKGRNILLILLYERKFIYFLLYNNKEKGLVKFFIWFFFLCVWACNLTTSI